MQRVMLLNPKGGSGKTTIATNLACCFAAEYGPTVLFDHDAQGSSTRWLKVRPAFLPEIYGVAAFRKPVGITRSFQMRTPAGTQRVVVDTPAGIQASELRQLVRPSDCIIIPVLASHIDIDAAAAFIEQLRSLPSIRGGHTRVAVVANRVRAGTRVLKELEDFLRRVDFPFVTRFRDSRQYLRASELGLGIHELPAKRSAADHRHWPPLLDWLAGRTAGEQPLEPLTAPARAVRCRAPVHGGPG